MCYYGNRLCNMKCVTWWMTKQEGISETFVHFFPSRTEMVTFPALILGNRSSSVCYLSVLGRMHAAADFNKPLCPSRINRNNHDCGV